MSEAKTFQRNWVAPAPIIHVIAGVFAAGAVANFLGRQWMWGAVDVLLFILAWVNLRWLRRTPIVRIGGGALVIQRHLLSRPRKLQLDAIAMMDSSNPSAARLVLRSGQSVSIPLRWIAWTDRGPFLAYLRSVVTPVTQ